jgi:hypothetical protein
VPLRLAGALHALALRGRAGLAEVYPPAEVPDDVLWSAVASALEHEAVAVLDWLDRPPQTNEVRRAAGLIAGAGWLGARFGLPLVVSELGASAGLNLMFDRFALRAGGARVGPPDAALVLAPDWRGPPPPATVPPVLDRRGVDLSPVDPATAEGRLALRACLWPDQPERRALTDAALAVAAATVDRGDAADWLETRPGPVPGALHLVWHSVAWQYFPPATQARAAAWFAAQGAVATPGAPLARLAMEADGAAPGAALWAEVWPGGQRHDLGRIDFHGRWVDWRGA